tara:strand:- start:518808 stop:520151 length:1344 start_codon:yes stop_codon:yes gene_type:complete
MKIHRNRQLVHAVAILAGALASSSLDRWFRSDQAVAQRSGDLTAELMNTYGLSAQGLVRKIDFSPLVIDPDAEPVEIKSGPLLLGDAGKVLQDGDLPLAMELFFAHTVAEYEHAKEPLSAVRFSQQLRRPVWQIRWGVSMALRGGELEDANPIGQSSSRGSSRGRNGEAEEPSPSEILEMAMGLVATTVAEEFETRFRSGTFGTALSLIGTEPPEEPAANQPRPRSSRGGDEPEPEVVAPPSILESGPSAAPIWVPGIVYLGEGASADRTEMARAMGIDFLLHFDVALKTGREDNVENTSRCRVIQVGDGRILGVSKGIDKDEAERYSRGGRGNEADYVKDQLTLILAIMDQKANVSEMPTLTKDIAKKRVGMLLSASRLPGASRPSLRTLAEIRLYQSLGLLDSSEVDSAFDYIGGADALFLLYGPLDQKLDRARQWAIDALSGEA